MQFWEQGQFIHIWNRALKGFQRTKNYINLLCQVLVLSTISYFQTSQSPSTWVFNMPLSGVSWSFPSWVVKLGTEPVSEHWILTTQFKIENFWASFPKEQGQIFCLSSHDFISGQLSQEVWCQQVNQIPLEPRHSTEQPLPILSVGGWTVVPKMPSPNP